MAPLPFTMKMLREKMTQWRYTMRDIALIEMELVTLYPQRSMFEAYHVAAAAKHLGWTYAEQVRVTSAALAC